MSWILYVIFLLIIGFTIYRHRFFHLPGLRRTSSLFFFALKLIAGLAVWYVYTSYYPQREYADIWKYYDDSEIIYEALDEKPGDYFRLVTGIGIDERVHDEYIVRMQHWDQQFENNLFNDSHTIIRFNALMRVISGGNYHTHSLVMCFLAFIGLCALYRWSYKFLWQWKYIVAFILFVSPSLLFWSSGVLKEGILFFALGMLIHQAWQFAEDKRKHRVAWILISIMLLAITKLYMLAFLLPALATGLYLRRNPSFAFLKVIGAALLLIAIAFVLDTWTPKFSPFRVIALKQRDFLTLARGGIYIMNDQYVCKIPERERGSFEYTDTIHFRITGGIEYDYWKIEDDFKDTLHGSIHNDSTLFTILSESPPAGSLMDVQLLYPRWNHVMKAAPAALGRSIYRPAPWELKPVLLIPAALENFMLYLLIFAMLLAFKKPSHKEVFWFCVFFAIITLTVIGLITPVLGALVRYRITAIPFLMFAILLCTNRENLLKRMPFLKAIF